MKLLWIVYLELFRKISYKKKHQVNKKKVQSYQLIYYTKFLNKKKKGSLTWFSIIKCKNIINIKMSVKVYFSSNKQYNFMSI